MRCRTACHSTKVPQPLELELKVVVSHLWWVLDLNSGSSLCSGLSHLSSPCRHAIANLWVVCSFFPLKTVSLPAPSLEWLVPACQYISLKCTDHRSYKETFLWLLSGEVLTFLSRSIYGPSQIPATNSVRSERRPVYCFSPYEHWIASARADEKALL